MSMSLYEYVSKKLLSIVKPKTPAKASTELKWATTSDSLRPGYHVYEAQLMNGTSVIVQEVSVGTWGWMLCDSSGWPMEMRNDFVTADQAKRDFESSLDAEGDS